MNLVPVTVYRGGRIGRGRCRLWAAGPAGGAEIGRLGLFEASRDGRGRQRRHRGTGPAGVFQSGSSGTLGPREGHDREAGKGLGPHAGGAGFAAGRRPDPGTSAFGRRDGSVATCMRRPRVEPSSFRPERGPLPAAVAHGKSFSFRRWATAIRERSRLFGCQRRGRCAASVIRGGGGPRAGDGQRKPSRGARRGGEGGKTQRRAAPAGLSGPALRGPDAPRAAQKGRARAIGGTDARLRPRNWSSFKRLVRSGRPRHLRGDAEVEAWGLVGALQGCPPASPWLDGGARPLCGAWPSQREARGPRLTRPRPLLDGLSRRLVRGNLAGLSWRRPPWGPGRDSFFASAASAFFLPVGNAVLRHAWSSAVFGPPPVARGARPRRAVAEASRSGVGRGAAVRRCGKKLECFVAIVELCGWRGRYVAPVTRLRVGPRARRSTSLA